jgi:hypothetical protein
MNDGLGNLKKDVTVDSFKTAFYRVPQTDVENQQEISVQIDGVWIRTRTRDLLNTNEEWQPLQQDGTGTEVKTAGEVQNTTVWMYWNC